MNNLWNEFIEFCKDKYSVGNIGENSVTFSTRKDNFEQIFHIYRKSNPEEIRIYALLGKDCFEKETLKNSIEIAKTFNKDAEIVTFQPTDENALQFIISINENTDLKFIESQLYEICDVATNIRKTSNN